MNVLIDKFPDAVTVCESKCKINPDFRNCLTILLAFEDPELTEQEKQLIMYERLYEKKPPVCPEAFLAAVWFLNGGKDRENPDTAERVYSFSKDAEYIYGGIRQTHSIDLESVDSMHWWKFLMLFMSLDESCFLNKIIALRSKKADGKLSKEEQEYCARMSDVLELPQPVTEEDMIADSFFSGLSD